MTRESDYRLQSQLATLGLVNLANTYEKFVLLLQNNIILMLRNNKYLLIKICLIN